MSGGVYRSGGVEGGQDVLLIFVGLHILHRDAPAGTSFLQGVPKLRVLTAILRLIPRAVLGLLPGSLLLETLLLFEKGEVLVGVAGAKGNEVGEAVLARWDGRGRRIRATRDRQGSRSTGGISASDSRKETGAHGRGFLGLIGGVGGPTQTVKVIHGDCEGCR
jgi:hypothetical protein